LSLTINILLNIYLIPEYGAVGAAIATAIAALFGNALSIYFGLKIFPLPLKINKLVSSYLILIAFTLIIYPIMMVNIHFAIKILLKTIMLFSFLILGIKMKYISRERLVHIINQFNFKSLKFT